MGNCVGAATSSNSVDKYALSVHKKIEEQIAKEANNASPIVKLLLLGEIFFPTAKFAHFSKRLIAKATSSFVC